MPQSNKSVSRQREWQKKQVANGRCMVCGKKAAKTNRGTVAQWCSTHQQQWRTYFREYQRNYRKARAT